MFGLFELIGESLDPGDVGGIECGAPEVQRRSSTVVLLHFIFAAFWLVFLAVYLIAAHYLSPLPDYDNLGWFGGIIDNPFRYSDDLNWMLITLKVILWPGNIVTVGLRDGYLGFTGQLPKPRKKKRKKKKPAPTTFEQHQTGETP
jgi:hypothetical protein